jgi:NAD(P)-dependent dehydrogenase (short-subunit alcohol dehydrogenase family)
MSNDNRPKTPSFRLDGRKVLVTGAGRGIGRAAALALADQGAHVVAVSRTMAELEALADEAPGLITPWKLDVTDIEATRDAVSQHGPFNVLFNNAGSNRPAPFLDVTEEDFDHVQNLNVKSAFFVAQATAQGMADAGIQGSIINVSSQMGHVGGIKRTVYCSTKFAIEGMTKAMAADLAPLKIRCNTICPTFIETPMTAPILADPGFKELVMDNILLGRTGKTTDLMGAIVFLASDASSLMTGSALIVDGGWTAV